jgi:hypothetical protein
MDIANRQLVADTASNAARENALLETVDVG